MMGYVVLWLSRLSFSLLLVAAAASLASRCKRPRWRRFWPIVAAILVLLPVAAISVIGGLLQKSNLQPKWLLWYGLTLAVAYISGVLFILKRGLKGAGSDNQTARSWPRGKLCAAFGLVLFVYIVTLNFIEARNLALLADARHEATSRIVSLLPGKFPDSLNSHHIYEQAAQALGPFDERPKWLSGSTSPDFDPASDEAISYLTRHKAVLDLLQRAASVPGYNPEELDVTNVFMTPLTRYVHHRDFIDFLILAAKNRALAKDPAAALAHLAIIQGMSNHNRGYPIIFTFWTSISLDKTRIKGLEYVLSHTPNPPKGLIRTPVPARASLLGSLLTVNKVEAQAHLQFFAISAASPDVLVGGVGGRGSSFNPLMFFTKFWRAFFIPSELSAAEDVIAKNMARPAKTYEEAKKNLRAIAKGDKSGKMGILTSFEWMGSFLYIGTPDFTSWAVRPMKGDVYRGLEDMALAATAYKAANGRYPAKAEDLVPNYIERIPTDPFDGKLIKMKHLEGGLDLFSVGVDPPDPKTGVRKAGTGPIHFYLGRKVYEEFRVKPAIEAKEEARKRRERMEKDRQRPRKPKRKKRPAF